MDTLNLGSKVCKYCGAYYSPEGTWHKENNDDVCDNCWNKYFTMVDGSIHWSREEAHKKKKKKWFQKIKLG